MALFEYKCNDCRKISEILVFTNDETPECTHCGSTNLEKLLSTFAVSMSHNSSSGPMPGCPPEGCSSCGLN